MHTIMECRTHMSMAQALQSRPQNGSVSKRLELGLLNIGGGGGEGGRGGP